MVDGPRGIESEVIDGEVVPDAAGAGPSRRRNRASSSTVVRVVVVGIAGLIGIWVFAALFAPSETTAPTAVPSPPAGLTGAQRQEVALSPEAQRLTEERNVVVLNRAEEEGRSAVAAPVFVPPALPSENAERQELRLPVPEETPRPPRIESVVAPLPQPTLLPSPPVSAPPVEQPVSPDLVNWLEQFLKRQGEASQTILNASVDEMLRERRGGRAGNTASGGPTDGTQSSGGGRVGAQQVESGAAAVAAGSGLSSRRMEDLGLVPGNILFARMVTEAISTDPGPVVAEFFDGPLRGSRVIGTFQPAERGLVVRFDKIVTVPQRVDERSVVIPVQAVAVDPDTMRPSVATSVDRRILERLAVTLASGFLSGLGQAVGRTGTVITTGPFGTVEQRVGQLNTRQQLLVATGQAAQEGGRLAQEIFGQQGPIITLSSGAVIGVLIISAEMRE